LHTESSLSFETKKANGGNRGGGARKKAGGGKNSSLRGIYTGGGKWGNAKKGKNV